jgi:NAD(P)-dependent dehydrogenase (short-subunit alcohol dehydrogenase family)
MKKLEGKVVLITGGTNGIGLASARLFKANGARLAVTGRDPESLAAAQEELGSDALVVASQAGDLAEVDALLAQVKERFGRLDVLFLNAGLSSPAPFEQVTEDQFDAIVGLNFKAAFFTIQKALPLFGDSASVIVTTSITNQTGTPNFSVYGASKAALRSLVQSLGLALIGRGIRVNAISPGPIDTNAFQRLKLPRERVEAIHADIRAKSPIKRFGSADEVAKVALFLASDDAAYIVGEEIVVDGGLTHVCLA